MNFASLLSTLLILSATQPSMSIKICQKWCQDNEGTCELTPHCKEGHEEYEGCMEEVWPKYGGFKKLLGGDCSECVVKGEGEEDTCYLPPEFNPWGLIESSRMSTMNQIIMAQTLAKLWATMDTDYGIITCLGWCTIQDGVCAVTPDCKPDSEEYEGCMETMDRYGGMEAFLQGSCSDCVAGASGKCEVPATGNPFGLMERGEGGINDMIFSRKLASTAMAKTGLTGIASCSQFCSVQGGVCKIKKMCTPEGGEEYEGCKEEMDYYGGLEAMIGGDCSECEVEDGKPLFWMEGEMDGLEQRCVVPKALNPMHLIDQGQFTVNDILMGRYVMSMIPEEKAKEAKTGITNCRNFCTVQEGTCKLKPDCTPGHEEYEGCMEQMGSLGGMEDAMQGDCSQCVAKHGYCRLPFELNMFGLAEDSRGQPMNQILMSRYLAPLAKDLLKEPVDDPEEKPWEGGEKKEEEEEEEEEEGEKEMMSCQDLKGMYKEYGCCGNPNKMIEMEKEGARRLTGIGGGIVDEIQKALKNAETSDGPDGALRLARKMMKAIAPTMEAAYRKSK